MVDAKKEALRVSEENGGKLEIHSKVDVKSMEDLAVAYTPGVAAVSTAIHEDQSKVYKYTGKKNTIAVVTDGSAVLGLGNIGAEAAIPVMEGKAVLFKEFAGVDAIPICLNTQNTEEIISHIKAIAPSFGGINLEDIGAPRCFEIEQRLKDELDIPVFHDDQHGTAIIVLGALYNALKLSNKKLEDAHIVINGGGAAGIAITKKFLKAGAKNIKLVDKTGIISEDNSKLEQRHKEIATLTNKNHQKGDLHEALKGADVFIGVSAPGVLKQEWIKDMNEKPIIFAMANPTPEIMPDETKKGGAFIVGTGRSDFPNQINNVLAFPGIFRGALDSRAYDITDKMQIAAAKGIAEVIPKEQLTRDYIIPDAFNQSVVKTVAKAVQNAAKNDG
ncbi:NAD-dependent malic enzyme [Tetragenococcus osmophilus]|uniref:Malate dehydrogenase n=1 Tax=Tetragenococcus osmophilus TaxID=526944 RepID=A0AA37XLQ7_9ENTE|nr:NADP-dependent malic enzyme [Tetragenococcus osmophilus]AYW47745.1 NAD-dependent malic enzyme [Tetragenococcus osmophilus]GMA53412.1 malate dehydrogenase [Alicyclobacillus contaminans]GMA72636.1 malate dehydrogenase [Tetragenococcus osmophilus]